MQVAEYKDGVWDGLPPKSRASLAAENDILRAHLINLGWTEDMLLSTQVNPTVARTAVFRRGGHRSGLQLVAWSIDAKQTRQANRDDEAAFPAGNCQV